MTFQRTKHDHLIAAALAVPGWYEKRVAPKIVVDPATGCWMWQASLSKGYAQIALPEVLGIGRQVTAKVSRVVWIRLRGEIPDNHVLDHDGPTGCSTKTCVSPDHVQPVTNRHNVVVTGHGISAICARRTTCPRGHKLGEGNVNPSSIARGIRRCVQCQRDRDRRDRAVIREAARLLGIQFTVYGQSYGWSRATAEQVIRERRQVAA